jgi:hypothetical protein
MRILLGSAVVAGLMSLGGAALADQCAALDATQAEAALGYLEVGDTVYHYCEPCGDTEPRAEVVESVTVEVEPVTPGAQEEAYREVVINGQGVDLAYLYVLDEDAWTNLAGLAQCPATDVSPVLTLPAQEQTQSPAAE